MEKLHEIYKLHQDDSRYCHKLTLGLKETFSKKISFFQSNNRCPNVVIASDSFEEVLTTIAHPETCIKSAAATFRADILSYCSAIKDQHWPPTLETVTAEYRSPPDSVKLSVNTLLYSGKKNIDKLDTLPRLVDSICADSVYPVSKGEVRQNTICLVLIYIAGQKLPIQIVNKLGHCIS